MRPLVPTAARLLRALCWLLLPRPHPSDKDALAAWLLADSATS